MKYYFGKKLEILVRIVAYVFEIFNPESNDHVLLVRYNQL